MGHSVRLFAGSLPSLRPFIAASPSAGVFALRIADILAVPISETVHDELHAAYGTGDWLEEGALLTSTDLAFAANASSAAPLAYLQTDFFGATGEQVALLWRDGGLALTPIRLSSALMRSRAPSFWPINIALKGLASLRVPTRMSSRPSVLATGVTPRISWPAPARSPWTAAEAYTPRTMFPTISDRYAMIASQNS